MIIGRRKFFSFFGTGVAMLANPDLFIPKKEIKVVSAVDWKWIQGIMDPKTLEALSRNALKIEVVHGLPLREVFGDAFVSDLKI